MLEKFYHITASLCLITACLCLIVITIVICMNERAIKAIDMQTYRIENNTQYLLEEVREINVHTERLRQLPYENSR